MTIFMDEKDSTLDNLIKAQLSLKLGRDLTSYSRSLNCLSFRFIATEGLTDLHMAMIRDMFDPKDVFITSPRQDQIAVTCMFYHL